MEHPRITSQTLAILEAILEDPLGQWYGLAISRSTQIKSGTLYPALARLEAAGWLESEWETTQASQLGRPRRRLYRLTGHGARAARQAVSESSARAPRNTRASQGRQAGPTAKPQLAR
jgi:DNA-binding PadR family transcriptional regulator